VFNRHIFDTSKSKKLKADVARSKSAGADHGGETKKNFLKRPSSILRRKRPSLGRHHEEKGEEGEGDDFPDSGLQIDPKSRVGQNTVHFFRSPLSLRRTNIAIGAP